VGRRRQGLVDRYCVGCHADEVYTRPDRKIRSPETLRLQVLRCNAMTKSGLTDEDVAAITDYSTRASTGSDAALMGRRLTDQQRARIARIQDDRRSRIEARVLSALSGAATDVALTGRVVVRHGQNLFVADEGGGLHHCLSRQNLGEVVCGDRVAWQPTGSGGVVTDRLDRSSTLSRPDYAGRDKAIAANITQIVVVVAARPEPNEYLVDQYLVAAEQIGVAALIALNKIDLSKAPNATRCSRASPPTRHRLPLVTVSAKRAQGLTPLTERLSGQTSILVGQSGVGKSSLVNALLPDARPRPAACRRRPVTAGTRPAPRRSTICRAAASSSTRPACAASGSAASIARSSSRAFASSGPMSATASSATAVTPTSPAARSARVDAVRSTPADSPTSCTWRRPRAALLTESRDGLLAAEVRAGRVRHRPLKDRPDQTEPWDGVRNYQARNMLRDQMRAGDLAFLYHSSCAVRASWASCRSCARAYPDVSQFDPDARYYDPKSSPANPRWYASTCATSGTRSGFCRWPSSGPTPTGRSRSCRCCARATGCP